MSENGLNSNMIKGLEIKIEVDPSALINCKNSNLQVKLNKQNLSEIMKKFKIAHGNQEFCEMTPPLSKSSSSNSSSNNSNNSLPSISGLNKSTKLDYYKIRLSRKFYPDRYSCLNLTYAHGNRPKTELTPLSSSQKTPSISCSRPRETAYSYLQKDIYIRTQQFANLSKLNETAEIVEEMKNRNRSAKERDFTELIKNGAEVSFIPLTSMPKNSLDNFEDSENKSKNSDDSENILDMLENSLNKLKDREWETGDKEWISPNLSPILKE